MNKIATLNKILATAAVVTAFTIGFAEASAMRIAGPTAPPIGHVQFCKDLPDECRGYDKINQVVKLSPEAWGRLLAINSGINAAVLPATDLEIYGVAEHWAYPRLAATARTMRSRSAAS